MSKESDKFFMPKSIFRGTNANGESFKMTEWEAGSLGHLTGGGGGMFFGIFMMAIFGSLVISIILPILLIYCIVKYNGRIQKNSIVGIIIAIYGLYDFHKHWFVWIVNKAFLGLNHISTVKSIIIASLVCQIILVAISIITKGSLYNEGYEEYKEYGSYKKKDNVTESPFLMQILLVMIISFIFTFIISSLI